MVVDFSQDIVSGIKTLSVAVDMTRIELKYNPVAVEVEDTVVFRILEPEVFTLLSATATSNR